MLSGKMLGRTKNVGHAGRYEFFTNCRITIHYLFISIPLIGLVGRVFFNDLGDRS